MEENYDSTWYDYDLTGHQLIGHVTYSGNQARLLEQVMFPTLKLNYDFLDSDKEKPVPAKKTPQQEIDEAVMEAIEGPRRLAEIDRRVRLVEEIGDDTHEPGSVLRWTRKFNSFGSQKEYTYAAIKVPNGAWYVTGSQLGHMGGWGWEKLVEWMVTGEGTVENLEVSTGWKKIASQ